MKKPILIICFYFLTTTVFAQNVTGSVTNTIFSYQQVSPTQHDFTFQTAFNLGSPGSCPQLINPTFTIVGGTLFVKGYYDIRGAWQSFFCSSQNTVSYNFSLPANVTHIITSTNVITYSIVPEDFTIVENVYTRDFDLNNLSTNNFDKQTISITPNPVNDSFTISGNLDFDAIKVYNNLGQVVKSFDKKDNFDVSELKTGLYFITVYDINNQKISETKLLKN